MDEQQYTPEVVLELVRHEPSALRYIPKNKHTKQAIRCSVEKSGVYLCYAKKSLQDHKNVRIACLNTLEALRFVKSKLQSEALLFELLMKKPYMYNYEQLYNGIQCKVKLAIFMIYSDIVNS